MPRKPEVNYFDILVIAAEFADRTADKLNELLQDYTDVHAKAEAIHDLEHSADHECHRLCEALNVAFITPIDREDIFALIRSIDDITDLLEDVSNRFDMFNIKTVRPEALKLGDLMKKATSKLLELVRAFKNYKKNKHQIHELIKIVNTLEEDGDRLYREYIKQLFLAENDVLEIIKWKEVFDDMENVLDACEDAADIIEGVVMKQN